SNKSLESEKIKAYGRYSFQCHSFCRGPRRNLSSLHRVLQALDHFFDLTVNPGNAFHIRTASVSMLYPTGITQGRSAATTIRWIISVVWTPLPEECPDYQHVTVVIHNAMPHNPFGLRSFYFRDGVEDDVVNAAIRMPIENIDENGIRRENGFLVRHNEE
ncbi:hypothetical protein COOONC_12406, partial [Cooperia oncophora]